MERRTKTNKTIFMIAILTCLNERPHVSPLIFECAKRLNKDEIYTHLIVGYTSPEDEKLAVEWAVECPWVHPVGPIKNVPGFKWNEVLKYAYYSVTGFGGFVIMGDDDSMSTEHFMSLNEVCKWHEGDYYGTNVNGFIEQKTGKALKHRYEMKNKLIGAGRYISRNAIEKTCVRQPIIMKRDLKIHDVTYQTGSREYVELSVADYLCGYSYAQKSGEVVFMGLWPDNAKQGLDHHSELNLVWNGFVPVCIATDDRIHISDVKSNKDGSPANIHTFSILSAGGSKGGLINECTFEDATWFMNENEKAICTTNRSILAALTLKD